MLLSAGERISCALLAMAIHTLGREAVSFTGSQAGIVTDTTHTKAKIVGISPLRVEQALADGKITLVAGFQGVSTNKDVTTLGRGGSDTTAVALAHALGAGVCEIYSDVDGVYTANPAVVANARKLHAVSYEEMLEMAASGAQVLALRSVEYARRYNVVIHSRSSFSDAEGTWVKEEDASMEQAIVSGVTYTTDEAKVTVRGVPDRPGVAADVFSALADAHVNVDMIIQNVGEQGHSDISCTVPIDDLPAAREALDAVVAKLHAKSYTTDDTMAKLSLIGAGMRSHPGVAALMFRTLADKGINLEMISTSPIKVSCVIAKERVEEAVRRPARRLRSRQRRGEPRAQRSRDRPRRGRGMSERAYTVAIVGATGVVGGTVRAILEQRGFPVGELRLLASARSRGAQLDLQRRAAHGRPSSRPTPSPASTSPSSPPAAP